MSGDLHLEDTERLAGEPLEVAPAAGAAAVRPVQRDVRPAPAAARAPGRLDDLEAGAARHGVLGREVEAEAERVRQHGRQLADLQHHAGDPRGAGGRQAGGRAAGRAPLLLRPRGRGHRGARRPPRDRRDARARALPRVRGGRRAGPAVRPLRLRRERPRVALRRGAPYPRDGGRLTCAPPAAATSSTNTITTTRRTGTGCSASSTTSSPATTRWRRSTAAGWPSVAPSRSTCSPRRAPARPRC